MKKDILNIYCPECGAPAKFDIINQVYQCSYCEGKVKIEDARQGKKELQKEQSEKLKESAQDFPLLTSSCSSCGATLIFEENEALSNCEFCGRSLARESYVYDPKMPQYVIPFAVTKDEASDLIKDWCKQNHRKPEAKNLLEKITELKGYYLPYEMVRGPVTCSVNKTGDYTYYKADGYLKDEFINCSSQLDNLVLDCMEPYNLDSLEEFDFAYVAGQRVKITDINDKEAMNRLNSEAAENYRPGMEKIWGTKAIDLEVQAAPVVKVPVLLPAYYIADGKVHAAVNGQTGKISVLSEEESTYIALPWWLQAILLLITASFLTFYAMLLGGMDLHDSLQLTGILSLLYMIVFAAMFEDGSSDGFNKINYRNIFSSGEQTYRRERGKLVLREDLLERKIENPVFRQKLGGKEVAVTYTFRSVERLLRMLLLGITVIFLPVIIALLINGFDFERLTLSASAAWFLLTVIVVPIYLVRFGIQWLYDRPLIYTITEDGKKKRYRKPNEIKSKKVLGHIAEALFIPPLCFATWFAIVALITMIYLTAFGFGGIDETPADENNKAWNHGIHEIHEIDDNLKIWPKKSGNRG